MAEEFQFADNHRDLCISTGTGAGFQFEFYCQCCNDTWRSPFEPFRSGQVSGWLAQAQSVLGSVFGNTGYALGRAAAGMAEAGWGEGRDEAFRAAIEQAKPLFHRCAKCTQVVCARCWNVESGLCRTCAPIEAAEVQAARTRGHVDAAAEAAYKLGQQRTGPAHRRGQAHAAGLPGLRHGNAWRVVLQSMRSGHGRAIGLPGMPCGAPQRGPLLPGLWPGSA